MVANVFMLHLVNLIFLFDPILLYNIWLQVTRFSRRCHLRSTLLFYYFVNLSIENGIFRDVEAVTSCQLFPLKLSFPQPGKRYTSHEEASKPFPFLIFVYCHWLQLVHVHHIVLLKCGLTVLRGPPLTAWWSCVNAPCRLGRQPLVIF